MRPILSQHIFLIFNNDNYVTFDGNYQLLLALLSCPNSNGNVSQRHIHAVYLGVNPGVNLIAYVMLHNLYSEVTFEEDFIRYS